MNSKNPFRETEDRLYFAKALDKIKEAQNKSRATYTDFMNPNRCAVFLKHFAKMNVEAHVYGGYDDAERKMIGFSSLSFCEMIFPIKPLTVTYNSRYSKVLTHRDFLGAVLGLGLDRGKIGDIRMSTNGAVIYIAEEVANFVSESLREVGSATVINTLDKELVDIETPGTQKRITTASLRLDAIISEAFHLSRSKATALIEADKVFVNWATGKKTRQLVSGDIVTIRQVGRLRIDEIIGLNKKDRIALYITLF